MPDGSRSIDELLADVRGRLVRLSPQEAYRAQQAGAALVDIRPQASREAEGSLPGAAVIERTVLEWRLDPASDSGLPFAAHDVHLVIVCNEGYSSSPPPSCTTWACAVPPTARGLPSLEGRRAPHRMTSPLDVSPEKRTDTP